MNIGNQLALTVLLLLLLSTFAPYTTPVQGQEELMIYFDDPLGGESWTGGSTQNITWNLTIPAHVDPMEVDVLLEYVYDGRGPYPIAQLTGDVANYSWDSPTINSDNVWLIIKAESSESRSFDIVEIKIDSSIPELMEYHPSQGETVPSTDKVELIFDQEVRVEDVSSNFTLLHDMGTVEGSFQTAEIDNNYSLTFIPFSRVPAGSNYSWNLDGGIHDSSSPGNVLWIDITVDFQVEEGPPEVTVVAPGVDTVVKTGEYMEIKWFTDQTVLDENPVNISYSADGGQTWISIVSGIDNTGVYNWTVQKAPMVEYPIVNAIVNVSSRSISGYEGYSNSGTFKIYDNFPPEVIIIRPYEGSYLVKDHVYNIRWEAVDDEPLLAKPITISVTSDQGETWKVIAQSISNSGEHPWKVEGIPSGDAILNVSCTDSHGAVSWDHSSPFNVLAENPLSLRITPANSSFNSRDLVNISWEAPDLIPETQRFRLLYSVDGETWIDYRELDPEVNYTDVPIPYEISSDFRFRLEMYDWEDVLFYADSYEFEVFPEILDVHMEYIDEFTFVTIRFNGYVGLRHMQDALTLYRNGEKVEIDRDDIYSRHSSIIVLIVNDLEPGDYSVELNSDDVEGRDFTSRDLISFNVPDHATREYWALLLFIPLALVLLYMYRGKGKEHKKVPQTHVKIHR